MPGVAAVRISRTAASAQDLPRRTQIVRLVAASGLPFAVPEPISEVTVFGERAAVATSWVGGRAAPKGEGDAVQVARLLRALRDVPLAPDLCAVLGEPH